MSTLSRVQLCESRPFASKWKLQLTHWREGCEEKENISQLKLCESERAREKDMRTAFVDKNLYKIQSVTDKTRERKRTSERERVCRFFTNLWMQQVFFCFFLRKSRDWDKLLFILLALFTISHLCHLGIDGLFGFKLKQLLINPPQPFDFQAKVVHFAGVTRLRHVRLSIGGGSEVA